MARRVAKSAAHIEKLAVAIDLPELAYYAGMLRIEAEVKSEDIRREDADATAA